MSIESAKEFLKKTSGNEKFLSRCNALANIEEKDIFLKENGFDFTEEELKEVMSELSDDDLDGAAGGLAYSFRSETVSELNGMLFGLR